LGEGIASGREDRREDKHAAHRCGGLHDDLHDTIYPVLKTLTVWAFTTGPELLAFLVEISLLGLVPIHAALASPAREISVGR
jgi:hypothetical protein